MKYYSKAFNGGIISREFWGRIDDIKYQTGLAIAENAICMPQGNVVNRTGTQYIATVKDSSKKVRIIEFDYDEGQNLIIEMGAGYFRWHNKNGTLGYSNPAAWSSTTAYTIGSLVARNGNNYYCILGNTNQQPPNATYWYPLPANNIYEIPNPYAESDLFQIKKVQSNDVITLVHKNYPPKELRRYGATDWRLVDIAFAPTTAIPQNVIATPFASGTTNITYRYKVTATDATGSNESYPSAIASCVNDLSNSGHYNTISWAAISGALRYKIYKESNGIYGYIGQAEGLAFKDDNIAADVGVTPPNSSSPFTSANNYPQAIGYFEQRKAFASTINKPNTLWMTKPFTENNLNYSIPSREDDRIELSLAFDKKFFIEHIVNLGDILILLSDKSELYLSFNGDLLSPATVFSRKKSQVGSSYAEPQIVESNVVFCSSRGGHVRALSYVGDSQKYITDDLSLRCHELFDAVTITDTAYQKALDSIVWFVKDDGGLFALSYIPSQQVWAWTTHVTDGSFESVAIIPEGNEDSVYFVTKRTINGQTKRYIEKLAPRSWTQVKDSVHCDSAVTYSGTATTTITGLSHLEGKVVSILADGSVHPQKTVINGAVTLDYSASLVHIGLPFETKIQTLPLIINADGYGKGRNKKVNKVIFDLYRSRSIYAGSSFDNLNQFIPRSIEAYGSAPNEVQGEIEIVINATWTKTGQICISQKDPLPINIMSMTLEVDSA